jgi:hypothetical protein
MSGFAGAVDVDLGVLTRLVAAAHLPGCGTWAEAEDKAEDDMKAWRAQLPACQHRVEVSWEVLAQIADAACAVMDRYSAEQELWTRMLAADLEAVTGLCHDAARRTTRVPTSRTTAATRSDLPATYAR